MAESLTVDFSRPLPLFPLANCTLLPHAVVPLHVFEPRYRALAREALESSKLIAMAVFEGDAWKDEYQPQPPIREHVCVGYVVRHERLPDGRYNILLQGVCRARIVRELEHEPYRVAMLEPAEMLSPMEIDLEEHRERIELLLNDRPLRSLAAVHAVRQWLTDEIPTAAMIDLAVLTLSQLVDERYAMLAEPDPEARAKWLEDHLRELRSIVEQAERLGSGKAEAGTYPAYLN